MKYVKMLGLLAIAAAALMAFAGPASATLTSPAGTAVPVGTKIKATSTHSELTGVINITCTSSTVEGTLTSNGAIEAAGTIETLDWSGCGNHTVTTTEPGTLEIEKTANGTGTVFSTGARVTVLTHSLFLGTRHCIYRTDDTHVGTFTGSGHAGATTGTIKAASQPIDRVATDSLCGEESIWHGHYVVTSPDPLTIS